MRDLYCFVIWILSSTVVIVEGEITHVPCNMVETFCGNNSLTLYPSCLEDTMRKCRNRGRFSGIKPGYGIQKVSSNATMNMTEGYIVHIPSEAVEKGINEYGEIGKDINFIVLVLNKTFFMTNSVSDVIGENVLGVWLGVTEVHNLSEPVQLKFKNTNQIENGVCVYWNLDEKTGGNWSEDGCSTEVQNDEFVCNCHHLSFFAVLINPKTPEEIHIVNLSYISYVGSALSIAFTGLVIVIFLWQRKKQSENSVMIHVQLTGSLFLLHISFLCSVWFSDRGDEVCLSLGLILHWCLLATFSWTAIEGFHLYLLLVRVFNIYIKRYTLKLSLVAWGVPTATVFICGIISKHTSVYGKYSIHEKNQNSTSTPICWITSQTASFITVNGYLGLVMIFNTIMFGVVLVKMRELRSQDVRTKNNKRRVWKDLVSLLGLCCVLGIPWSLAFFTRTPLNLPALYMFTILNSFQGVFIFLWFLTLTCKAREEEYVSSKGTLHVSFQSNEERVTTSFVDGKN
ncbi:adhesion G protein-coupled receptor G3 [Triplophysa dalaica]|uniref:adhesion G protein-coupled receptor G3 n=1 Tax=Triplophysa dalaica TaxID=1582913 RepID=UPI0024DF61F6|nr:adhesion G protein-coupled receptor G3 [Triplophysa dalaica]